MTATDQVEFNIKVGEQGATEEDIDIFTCRFLAESQELDIECAELAKGWPVSEGSPEESQNLLAMLEKGRKK